MKHILDKSLLDSSNKTKTARDHQIPQKSLQSQIPPTINPHNPKSFEKCSMLLPM